MLMCIYSHGNKYISMKISQIVFYLQHLVVDSVAYNCS